MGLFRHPHLTRGVVHTSEGAFRIERGVADVPDDIGEALGWNRIEEESEPAAAITRTSARRSPEPNHAGAA